MTTAEIIMFILRLIYCFSCVLWCGGLPREKFLFGEISAVWGAEWMSANTNVASEGRTSVPTQASIVEMHVGAISVVFPHDSIHLQLAFFSSFHFDPVFRSALLYANENHADPDIDRWLTICDALWDLRFFSPNSYEFYRLQRSNINDGIVGDRVQQRYSNYKCTDAPQISGNFYLSSREIRAPDQPHLVWWKVHTSWITRSKLTRVAQSFRLSIVLSVYLLTFTKVTFHIFAYRKLHQTIQI